MKATQRYASTQNETASPQRLMVLLFEAALRHIRTAAQAFEDKRIADGLVPLRKAMDIVTELHTTLDRSKAPELCERLSDSYVFVSDRLLKAISQRDGKWVREAERAFAPIVEGFAGAVASLQKTSQTG